MPFDSGTFVKLIDEIAEPSVVTVYGHTPPAVLAWLKHYLLSMGEALSTLDFAAFNGSRAGLDLLQIATQMLIERGLPLEVRLLTILRSGTTTFSVSTALVITLRSDGDEE
jgi:hypothetical protein